MVFAAVSRTATRVAKPALTRNMSAVTGVKGRYIIDSRGNPTVEASGALVCGRLQLHVHRDSDPPPSVYNVAISLILALFPCVAGHPHWRHNMINAYVTAWLSRCHGRSIVDLGPALLFWDRRILVKLLTVLPCEVFHPTV